MDYIITAFVGLDVHKKSVAMSVAEPGRAAPQFVGMTRPQLSEILKALAHLGAPQQALIAYEAGPCGYRLARELAARGYRCEVIAVAKMPRRPGDRIKTDRRDALTLARHLRWRADAGRDPGRVGRCDPRSVQGSRGCRASPA